MHLFKNFKGFADAEINLFAPVTLLIGPNSSGKSNLIEGVQLLAEIAHGRSLHEIADVRRSGGQGVEIRGGLGGCARHGHDAFSMGFSGMINFEGQRQSLSYEVEVTVRPSAHISQESLCLGKDTLIFQTLGPPVKSRADVVAVRYNNFAKGRNKPHATIRTDRSALSQYEEFAEKNQKLPECRNLVRSVRQHLRASFVFDPDPKAMRDYQRIADQLLTRNASNLSAVLYALKSHGGEDVKTLDRLLERIKQVPEEPYASFEFVTTKLNDVIFGFHQTPDGPLLDAKVLSDGTLRCLAVLTALETVEKGSRIVIEEFDNGLHSTRLNVLTKALTECAGERKLNGLVTTHNPATLNALAPEQLDCVVLCSWDKEQEASRLVRLKELPKALELFERGRLGDLVTRKVIDQYLAPNFEDAQVKKALDWLESLP